MLHQRLAEPRDGGLSGRARACRGTRWTAAENNGNPQDPPGPPGTISSASPVRLAGWTWTGPGWAWAMGGIISLPRLKTRRQPISRPQHHGGSSNQRQFGSAKSRPPTWSLWRAFASSFLGRDFLRKRPVPCRTRTHCCVPVGLLRCAACVAAALHLVDPLSIRTSMYRRCPSHLVHLQALAA